MKKLTQGMAQQNKTMATAMSDEEKANIVSLYPALDIAIDTGNGLFWAVY